MSHATCVTNIQHLYCTDMYYYSLLSLVTLGLGYRLFQGHLEVVAPERVLAVEHYQTVQAVKHVVIYQVVLGLTQFLARLDTAMVHRVMPSVNQRLVCAFMPSPRGQKTCCTDLENKN